MAMPSNTKHWLWMTPEEFLVDHNARMSNSVQCNTLKIRTFIFCKKSLLLVGHDDKWVVPTLIHKKGGKIQSQIPIVDSILSKLGRKFKISNAIRRDLQFMEFSQIKPLITSYPLNQIYELSLSAILTTASNIELSLPKGHHWVPQSATLNLAIPPIRPSMREPIDLQYIVRAFGRLDECRSQYSTLTTSAATHIIHGVLCAVHFAEDEENVGNGWIALDNFSACGRIALFPAESRGEAEREGSILDREIRCRIVGRWWEDEEIVWAEEVGDWGDLVNKEGRLRVECAAKERVDWDFVDLTEEEKGVGSDQEEEESWGIEEQE
ncbi:hypothetical protein PRZ48_008369 [Zasmidium cellare]|uniref:Uncharacterized protein n=1 Tax=Zasmidium cellare TaxID=395010 RepID=A0ABR0EGI7_ZASCE|nr:hypothetical protein PRZ48_008369 [Zasmidium cellare]